MTFVVEWSFLYALHEVVWVSEGIAPCILNCGIRWRWLVSFTAQPLYSWEKNSHYSVSRSLDGFQIWSEHSEEEKSVVAAGNCTMIPWLSSPQSSYVCCPHSIGCCNFYNSKRKGFIFYTRMLEQLLFQRYTV